MHGLSGPPFHCFWLLGNFLPSKERFLALAEEDEGQNEEGIARL